MGTLDCKFHTANIFFSLFRLQYVIMPWDGDLFSFGTISNINFVRTGESMTTKDEYGADTQAISTMRIFWARRFNLEGYNTAVTTGRM